MTTATAGSMTSSACASARCGRGRAALPTSLSTLQNSFGSRSPSKSRSQAAGRELRDQDRTGLERSLRARKGVPARVRRIVTELFLDAEELVVLRDAVGARGGARLDLACAERDGEVCDRRVLRFA